MSDETKAELEAAKELNQKEETARLEKQKEDLKEERSDGMDSFQHQQKEATEEHVEKLLSETGDTVPRTLAMSPEYSPPGTIRGTDGSNANFNPDRVSDPEGEWDAHGGEKEEQGENYEPKKIPE